MKKLQLLPILLLSLLTSSSWAQAVIPESYINPLDLDYTYMVYNSSKNISYRSGADPAVIQFRGEYYLFVTRSFGYWHSTDLVNWEFIKPKQWFFEGSNA
ncbi:MAG TPA: 1,4-beta-xylanase, partial [Leeuwenhoekiella sp.]|nr:1,4-beta-xylanase [Leeuwenhoekiella sp.]